VYALARIHAAHAARYYQSVGVRAYVGYLFHHDSPIRSPPHLSGRICRDVAAVARGQADHVDVGDPEMVKEWGFAGDAAAALATLAGQDQVFEAVIGTGEGQTVGAWVERCFAQAGLSASGRVRVVEGFPVGPRSIVSRPDTLRSLGWSPAVTFDGLAAMMMRRVLERIGSP
jgi:GDPmannose 4,6-dehydratase